MRATKSLSVLSLAVVSALALSACSAGGGGGGGELSYEDSPLSSYMTALYGDVDQKKLDAQNVEMEDLIAACMKEEGFEYLPNTQNGARVAVMDGEIEDQNTEKWVASNGYGMVQTQEQMEEQQSQSEEYVDPNADYLAELSATEQTAFYEVLYGPGPSEEELAAMEEGDGSYAYNWETAGCQGAAQHEVQGASADAYTDPAFAGLFENMNQLYTKLADQPKMKALDAEWAACMADAGYAEFSTKQDAFMSISDAQNAYYENMEVDEQGMPVGQDESVLADLKQLEIDTALADFTCSEKIDYTQQSLTAQFELEKQFIEDNKSELDALLAEYSTGK